MSTSNYLLLLYRNTIDLHILTLYPMNLINSHTTSRSFLAFFFFEIPLGFLM